MENPSGIQNVPMTENVPNIAAVAVEGREEKGAPERRRRKAQRLLRCEGTIPSVSKGLVIWPFWWWWCVWAFAAAGRTGNLALADWQTIERKCRSNPTDLIPRPTVCNVCDWTGLNWTGPGWARTRNPNHPS